MDRLKEPEMMLSVANSVGLVGVTAYFYKQLEAMRMDMNKISQALRSVISKVAEIEKGDQNKSETLHMLNDQVKLISDEIKDFPSFDDVDLDLSEIIHTLEEHDIPVERPSQAPRQRKLQGRARREPESDASTRSNRSSRYESKERKPVQRQRNESRQDPQDDSELINEVRGTSR